MNADDLLQLAEDPHFIEGIYNYCDRWCERCPFTARCLNYAQLQAMEDERGFDPTRRDANNAAFWQTLQESFQIAQELLERAAAERGIDIHSPEFPSTMEEAGEERERMFEAACEHYLTRAAEEYGMAVENWFERKQAALGSRLQQARASDEIRPDKLQPEDVADAIEIIRWYQFLPAAKLVGVLSVKKFEGNLEVSALREQSDNGRIKVALIGIDRSLLAWGRMQLFWPQGARGIMHLASLAAELRLLLERAFPNARDFSRPGFDDASTLLM
jgi:hypothetical protein